MGGGVPDDPGDDTGEPDVPEEQDSQGPEEL